ncbi:MAG: PstS family phosphate ABC transporter substrate-binding protein [Thiotrichales bacterium]|nr:PstS family phosphate ABC transporter substrate-binding protein [Thiotrichales bacterium]
MNKKLIMLAVAAMVSASGLTANAASRDYIEIVGSSTVYPFATVVAETFGKNTEFKTPKIESTGSGGGLKLFCQGIGQNHPDITNASRRIKQSEIDKCISNGVKDIIEVKVGYDGIVFANSKKADIISITRKEIFLALAKEVPNPSGSETLIENPYTTWNEVNPELPKTKIEVLGPPPTSGTRDAFVELAMEGGCKAFDWIKAIKKVDKQQYKSICHSIREDGAYVEAGENDNLIVRKLEANPNAFGIFGYSFLDQNSDKVQGAKVDGVAPEFDSIADGDYPISRSLYLYLKKAHVGVTPGLQEFVSEFMSDRASGEEGYLSDRGLIPLPDEEHAKFKSDIADLNTLPENI